MINQQLEQLTATLLDKHRFFDRGFANVYLDEISGLIYQGDSFEKFGIGIDDRFGNYFYLRTEATIDYSDSRPQISDSRRSVDETMRCYLVAIVDKADPKLLVQSLLNTLLQYGNEKIRPVRAIHHRETAVAKELSKIDKEDLKVVLSLLDEKQVVIIEFSFTTQFTSVNANCIPSPCKNDC